MKHKTETENLIATMTTTTFGQTLSSREKHLFRESLHGLVRLAKAEQMLEIRHNVEKLTGVTSSISQKGKKAQASPPDALKISQQRFEFLEDGMCNSGNHKNP